MKASERVRQEIEEQIRTGGLLPGDPIDEQRLMGQFGVSRTPVREALLQLKSQGLLTSLPRGGVVVAKMDVQQLFAMWELLGELESLCARYACERMSNAERSALAQVHEAAGDVVARDDTEGWQAANLAFHEALYAGARNPYLRQEIIRMRVRTQAYRRHAFAAIGRLQTSHHHHGLILAAILACDSRAAAAAALSHLCPGEGARGVGELILNLPRELLG